jgi:hypothetical protein
MKKHIVGVLILMTFFNCKSKSDDRIFVDNWSVEMGYHYLLYYEGENSIYFDIEPMYSGPDLIYLPNNDIWNKTKPSWLKNDLSIIKDRIISIKWNRDLSWYEANISVNIGPNKVIKGTIESTKGGSELEKMRLFNPGKDITSQQARVVWNTAVINYTKSLQGEVTVFDDGYIKNSVYEKVILPNLLNNKNVKVIHKK